MSNVFDSQVARANSCYARPVGGKLFRVHDPDIPVPVDAEFVHNQVRALIGCAEYVCAGARAAFEKATYRFGFYNGVGSPSSSLGLARDLMHFVTEQPHMEGNFTTFVASFRTPDIRDEFHFEQLVWKQLQLLHNLDVNHHSWDTTVSDDPEDPRFEFSFGGRAYFVIGLSPVSSRLARRFAYPTLVFNAHYQFERLRAKGQFERFQNVIRNKDIDLQGMYNPNLADFGGASAARQYSGRKVESDWRCPFHVQPDPTTTT